MQVLGTWQVDEEEQDSTDMEPPEGAVQDGGGIGIQAAEQWVEPCTNGCPGAAIVGGCYTVGGSVSCVLKAFDQGEGDDDGHNQSQDDVAIPGAMQEAGQLSGPEDCTAKGKEEQGDKDKYDECIQDNSEGMIIAQEW